jgi:hypothetical protein
LYSAFQYLSAQCSNLRAYPNNPSGWNLMALQSHEFYPISVKRIGS